MATGFLSGLVVGAVVSGAALGAMSLATGPEQLDAPGAAVLDVPAGSEFNQSRDDTAARLPQQNGAPDVIGTAPKVNAAAPDDLAAVSGEQTQPSARPEPGGVDADLSAPQILNEGSGMASGGFGRDTDNIDDAAVPEGAAQTAVIGADTGTIGTTISDDPAQPSLPEVESGAGLADGGMADQSVNGEGMVAEGVIDGGSSESNLSARVPEAEQTGTAVSASGASELTADDLSEAEDAALARDIGDVASDVETGRLPSVGAAPTEAPVTAPDAILEARPAIVANAEVFANPEGKPLMAIVLIDDGTSPIGLDALDAFPYPLSFAVDAGRPGAKEAMARYRDAGFEVLAIADLPEEADARDTETVMQTVFAAVPEAVAVLEGTGTGLQVSRDSSEQLAPILLESGHGLVVFPKGLQTARKLIAREGVPVGTIFRDFDASDQSATVIRRFLDQAAFKAGRDEGGVIMLGRLRADTISALLLWGLQDRASRVALAPISAVLTAEN